MSDKDRCRGCRDEFMSTWAGIWYAQQESEMIARSQHMYGLLPESTLARRRIMISTNDVWGGSWSPVHIEIDERPWLANPSDDEV